MVCKQLLVSSCTGGSKNEWVDLSSGHRHCKSLQEKGIRHKLIPEWRKNVREVEWTQTQSIHLSHASMCSAGEAWCASDLTHVALKPPVPSGRSWTAGLHLSCSQDGQGSPSIITDSTLWAKVLVLLSSIGTYTSLG